MKKIKKELQDLKTEFQITWEKMFNKNETLGLAVDKNAFKSSLLEILYRANEIREELIETGLFENGVSKIEIELDHSDTLEKILTQFDNIIADIDDVLKINLKEVATKILSKNPYLVLHDEDNKVATEIATKINESSHKPIGSNFENFPFELTGSYARGTNKRNIQFLDINGEIVDTCHCIDILQFTNPSEVNRLRRKWDFKSNDETIIVAVISTINSNFKEETTSKGLIFLTKPYTVKEIREIRNSHFNNIDNIQVQNKLLEIETIWK